MEMQERPVPARSHAWILVACLIPLPLIAALVLDARSVTLLVAVVISGLIAVAASLVWAIQRTRGQRRIFESQLAAWAGERAAQQERLRIARELHDISSHGLGVITMRAASAGYLTGPDADTQRQQAFADIERVSRATTTELRRMLTLLRSPDHATAPLQPAETLAALPGIIEDAEREGLTIHATVENLSDTDGTRLGPGVQLAICAIVREALTNVLRHAGPTTVTLSIARHSDPVSGDTVDIDVNDDGANPGWSAEPGTGHGLIGLRERVNAHGGILTAAHEGRGFRVHAALSTEILEPTEATP